SKNNAELAERLTRTPRQIETPRIGAVDDVHIVIAGYKRQTGSQLRIVLKKVDELRPFGPRTGIGDIARHQYTIERGQRGYRGELAPSVANAPVTSRAVRTGLHAITVTLADEVKVRQMRHSSDRRFSLRRVGHPIENRAADRELAPEPIQALDHSG